MLFFSSKRFLQASAFYLNADQSGRAKTQFFVLFHKILDFLFLFYMKLETYVTYKPNILYTVAAQLKLQHLIYFQKFCKNISKNLPA